MTVDRGGHRVVMHIGRRGGRLTVDRTVSAAPGAVWAVLTDLAAWPRWGPTVAGAELLDGDELALGVHGRVWTPVGVALPFTVTEFDPGRRWAWRVAGVAATDHTVERTSRGARVSMGVPLWAPAYLPVCALALQRIDRMVCSG